MNNNLNQQIKKALVEKGKGTGFLLQNICDSPADTIPSYNDFLMLLSRWVNNDDRKLRGITTGKKYTLEQNQVTNAVIDLIDQLDDNALESIKKALADIERSPYKILTLSKDEDERQKMEELLNQFPELNFKAALSSAPPEGTNTYHLLIFDNLSLGEIDDIRHFSDADREHLELMQEWLVAKEKAAKKKKDQQAVRPGFIIHYGKRCFLVGEYSEYCAAANFPFTLYGLIQQILDYWERS